MFRRFLVSAFALLCLLSGTGLSLQHHYCGGDLASVDVLLPGAGAFDACGSCGMEEGSADCCKNVLKVVKAPETGRFFKAILGFTHFDWIAPAPALKHRLPAVPVMGRLALKAAPLTRPPPLAGRPPLFVQQCVFRI